MNLLKLSLLLSLTVAGSTFAMEKPYKKTSDSLIYKAIQIRVNRRKDFITPRADSNYKPGDYDSIIHIKISFNNLDRKNNNTFEKK